MLRLSKYTRLDSSKRLNDYFKASAIQGLIATSGLKAIGFIRNLILSLKKKKRKRKNANTYSAPSGYRCSKRARKKRSPVLAHNAMR